VVGASLAGLRAVETLRAEGYDGSITVVGAEEHLPYDRPPLSKQVLVGRLSEAELSGCADDWYADNAIDVLLGDPVTRLDAAERAVVLGSGRRVPFGRLLIATGSAPRRLPGAAGFENVHELRTLADARRLRDGGLDKGYTEGENFRYVEEEGARHTEATWRRRFKKALPFLLSA